MKKCRHQLTWIKTCLISCMVLGLANFASRALSLAAEPGQYTFEQQLDKVSVYRDGQLVTRLMAKSGHKPVFYPVMGPDNVPLTRAYPIEDARDGEAKDHIHHRSLWFTHGEVNGVDYWAEGEGKGTIEQKDVEAKSTSDGVVINSKNEWVQPDGTVVLHDSRTVTFHDVAGMQAIDFVIHLRAGEQDVVMGDTKEGSFGVRVAGTMKVTAKLGGHIESSEGLSDGDAWGKQASWVDYTGPVNGKTYGIAILNHPTSFNYPTRWHVRDYGLFAANPFGVHHFVGGDATEGTRIEAGKELTLRYRILLHRDDTKSADIARQWQMYAETE